MKKFLALVFAVIMTICLVGCGSKESKNVGGKATGADAAKTVKAGFIFIGDENDGYTYAFYKGAMELKTRLGIPEENIVIKWNIPEGEEAYEAACELADEGCDIVFANSYGHEDYIMQAAEEYPDVEFCHATGDKAKNSGLPNFHNYYVSVEESRYVSGIVAGYKLNEMMENEEITAEEAKVGYVGAFPFAQVISGFDAFYLGVKSICPEASMVVKYTNTWGDQATEYNVAKALIEEEHCVLISQHSNTTGPSSACEELGVYSVGYNISMLDTAPNYALTSASLDWAPYTEYAVKCVMEGKEIETDWCEGYDAGACLITEINEKAFSEEVYSEVTAKISETEQKLKNEKLAVFDVSAFTVGGAQLDEETVDSFGAKPVFDGVYHESYFQSAPGAVFIVDGITELD